MHRSAAVATVFALACLAAGKPPASLTSLADAGRKLTDDAAKKLAAAVAADPNDADDRARLLGYYATRQAAYRDARLAVVLWMIARRPGDPVLTAYGLLTPAADPAGYAKAAAAWDAAAAAHATDLPILSNAAAFFDNPADDAKAEALLHQAIGVQPAAAVWQVRLAELFEARAAAHADAAAACYAQAIDARQTAYKLAPEGVERFHVLIGIPWDTLGAGDTIAAKRSAGQLLAVAADFKADPAYGEAVHRADVVLGHAALAVQQVERADGYLAAAAAVPFSPRLDAAGPDTSLAKALLDKGERAAVRSYLLACGRIWPGGSTRLKSWVAAVDAGNTPDFTK